MKKYTTPEVEIKRFNTEDIMNSSATANLAYTEADVAGAAGSKVDSVTYDELFNL